MEKKDANNRKCYCYYQRNLGLPTSCDAHLVCVKFFILVCYVRFVIFCNIQENLKEFKEKARKEIEKLTAMNVVSMDVVAKSVYIPNKE